MVTHYLSYGHISYLLAMCYFVALYYYCMVMHYLSHGHIFLISRPSIILWPCVIIVWPCIIFLMATHFSSLGFALYLGHVLLLHDHALFSSWPHISYLLAMHYFLAMYCFCMNTCYLLHGHVSYLLAMHYLMAMCYYCVVTCYLSHGHKLSHGRTFLSRGHVLSHGHVLLLHGHELFISWPRVIARPCISSLVATCYLKALCFVILCHTLFLSWSQVITWPHVANLVAIRYLVVMWCLLCGHAIFISWSWVNFVWPQGNYFPMLSEEHRLTQFYFSPFSTFRKLFSSEITSHL